MPKSIENSVLTEDFLFDLYKTCITNERVLSIFTNYIEDEYLPDRDFVRVSKALKGYYEKYKSIPEVSIISQEISSSRAAKMLFDDIVEQGKPLEQKQVISQLETYIKQVRFQKMYREVGALYNKQLHKESFDELADYVKWADSFTLTDDQFVDVVGTFKDRFKDNKEKHEIVSSVLPVNRFYIDALDNLNGQRNLRGQLSCFLASTGVGKSHIARWIGKSAALDGLSVLHIQLEGSEKETVDAYSAALAGCDVYKYAIGGIDEKEIEEMFNEIQAAAGKLYVRTYPKFNSSVSTINIKNAILDFEKRFGKSPDIVIIDSMDLLEDASGKNYSEKGERFKRVRVANDLKDLAADTNAWIIATYQSTIEDREKINDENFVLSEYNCSEAKGLARPVTHLISLNQSSNESKEGTMRLFVAKSRFFKKGQVIKIANDYEHEQFYDKLRTMNIQKTEAATSCHTPSTRKRRATS